MGEPTPFGKYLLLREAGRGGNGVVYEARDTVLDRRVALKMSRSGQEDERFLTEARLCANLPKHPHVVTVFDAGVVDGKRFMAMEFIQGQPMNRRKNLVLATQIALLRDVALAVDHAHRHGLVHRDLKPQNILVDERGEPHVTDFGLAMLAGQPSDDPASEFVRGTPTYMSPEQAKGTAMDRRTDVYSLGVLLYEILAGRPPFQGANPGEILKKVVHAEPPPLRDVPGLSSVCRRALSKDPAHRQQTARAFADDLTKALGAPEKKKKLIFLGAAAAVVIAAVIGFVVFASG